MNHCRLLHIALLMVTMAFAACGSRRTSAAGDFDNEIYTPKYASGFSLKSAGDGESVLISVNNPWQGADSVTTKLLIVRGDESVPADYDGQVLRGEARRIVTMSSTHVAMLDALGAIDRVVGVSGADFISNEYIRQHRDSVGDVGYDGNINYELLVSLSPDVVLLYGVNGASSLEGKLRELGIPFMYVGDYLEQSPLGKAEWMVALAELIGARDKGVAAFEGISQRYNNLKESVAKNVTTAPKVMFNMPYGDSWFMPSADNYAVQLISDAGGDYIYKKNRGNASVTIDMEEAYLLTSQADVWINVGRAASLKEVADACPKFTDTPCFLTGKVYNNNRRTTPMGGNDYYESAVVNPDIILRDLVKVLHPELVEEDFVYYQQLK
jgi:iron complex transport system substrate-binding protein